jgi:3-dehydroquinate synthetase/ABC-type sugar transport system substrate-binding protein
MLGVFAYRRSTKDTVSTMKPLRIGACLKAEDNPFWSVEVRRGLEEGAKSFNDVRLTYRTPERITDLQGQRRIIRDFIRMRMDAIIVAPSDPKRIIPSLRQTYAVGIPTVVIDSRPDAGAIRRFGIHLSFIGFDDYTGGFETGRLLARKLPRQSEVAVVQGYRIGSYTERVRGFREAVGTGLKLRAVVSANFEEDAAYQQTLKLIRRFPNLRGIFCTSDNMAMGALTALFELNKPSVRVCGFDATHAGRLALERGRLLSTVDSKPMEMGRLAIQRAREIVERIQKPTDEQYPVHLLTKEELFAPVKRIVQRRTYRILRPLPSHQEFEYARLHESLECPILIGTKMFEELPPRLTLLDADRYWIINDATVKRLYGEKLRRAMERAGLATKMETIAPGESNKTFTTLNLLASTLLDSGVTKRSVLVLLGGGVVGNLAGFLASILMRGVRFVHVPTTVMAQIDSTTGGKQAVNTPQGKNLLGTYYEPEFIYIDPSMVETLSTREYRSGIAEAIKHGLCQSPQLLQRVRERTYEPILLNTIRLKVGLIEDDPLERGRGLALLYGHTLGHAIETASNHALNHGEAISIGMLGAALVSEKLGIGTEGLAEQHQTALCGVGLPILLPRSVDINAVFRTLQFDKKERSSVVPFVLLERIGKLAIRKGKYSVPVGLPIVRTVVRALAKK